MHTRLNRTYRQNNCGLRSVVVLCSLSQFYLSGEITILHAEFIFFHHFVEIPTKISRYWTTFETLAKIERDCKERQLCMGDCLAIPTVFNSLSATYLLSTFSIIRSEIGTSDSSYRNVVFLASVESAEPEVAYTLTHDVVNDTFLNV